jgi:hypothetical protein
MSRFRFFFAAFVSLILSINPSWAGAPAEPKGPDAGNELAAQLRALRPEENGRWSGSLSIFGRGHDLAPIPVSCETTLGETNWSVTNLASATADSPGEMLKVVFSTNAPNEYFYSKAPSPGAPLGAAKQLTGAEADIPLAGSDFWLSDLGFEFYHWPQQNRLMGEYKSTRACYVLESVNPHPSPGGYGRVITWIDRETNEPLLAEAYAADGKTKLKSFKLGSVTKLKDGHYVVKNLKMTNLKTDSRTFLNFDIEGQ